MTTKQILETARKRISDENDWTKGSLSRGGRVCALGAIAIAIEGSTDDVERSFWLLPTPGAAIEALAAVLPENDCIGYCNRFCNRISKYNDDAATTHACILAAFDAAFEAA